MILGKVFMAVVEEISDEYSNQHMVSIEDLESVLESEGVSSTSKLEMIPSTISAQILHLLFIVKDERQKLAISDPHQESGFKHFSFSSPM